MTRRQSSHAIVLSFVLLSAGLTVAQDPVIYTDNRERLDSKVIVLLVKGQRMKEIRARPSAQC